VTVPAAHGAPGRGGGASPRAGRRGGPARPIRDVLPSALRALGVAPKAVSRRVAAAWKTASEGAWAGRAVPDRLLGGTLFVRVSSAPLRQELAQFHAARLLTVLGALLPDDPIVALRFEAGSAGGVAGGGRGRA
jgi:hypothetical protein